LLGGAVTVNPSRASREMTPFQLDASAQAPWIRTMVGLLLSMRDAPFCQCCLSEVIVRAGLIRRLASDDSKRGLRSLQRGRRRSAWTSLDPQRRGGARTERIVSTDAEGHLSFETDVKPLFRERDRQSMEFAFDLWSYDDVRQNADAILARLADGTMPCEGAWPQAQVDLFRRWAQGGMPA
jgi:hypothetical protein